MTWTHPNEGTRARGYDKAHWSLRERYAELVRAGDGVCCRCGGQILEGDEWHLDHSEDRDADRLVDRYRGISHRGCNLRAAARKAQRRSTVAKKAARGRSANPDDPWGRLPGESNAQARGRIEDGGGLRGPNGEAWSKLWFDW